MPLWVKLLPLRHQGTKKHKKSYTNYEKKLKKNLFVIKIKYNFAILLIKKFKIMKKFMKKISVLIALSLMCGILNAQNVITPKIGVEKGKIDVSFQTDNANAYKAANFIRNSTGRLNKTIITGYIDYSWQNSNDLSYVWQFNSLFTGADTAFNYVGVAIHPFEGILDYSDNVFDFQVIPYPANFTFTIDSIIALITHENNSGTYNKLTMQIVQLSTSNTLTATSPVLWSYVDSTDVSLSPGGNWLGEGALVVLGYEPNFTTTPGQKVGLVFKYEAPDTDSLGVLGSCIDDGAGGTVTQSPYPTSFMQYPPYINSIDANRNIGYGDPVGSEGWIEAQDWEIWVKVTFDDMIGINDIEANKNVILYQNIPNPAIGSTIIKYNLSKDANINFALCDITGRKVFEKSENNVTPGTYKINLDVINLSEGVYFYTLTANGYAVTKKMVVVK